MPADDSVLMSRSVLDHFKLTSSDIPAVRLVRISGQSSEVVPLVGDITAANLESSIESFLSGGIEVQAFFKIRRDMLLRNRSRTSWTAASSWALRTIFRAS